jgi:hypothetical protein
MHQGPSDTFSDGMTFTVQNAGPTAIGGAGDDLGFGGIPMSAAVKLDAYPNEGDPSSQSTGIFLDGAHPIGGKDLTCCVDLLDHTILATISYDSTLGALSLRLDDETQSTVFGWTWSPVDIPGAVGGDTAYVGFTGGNGGFYGAQEIQSWDFESGVCCKH